MGCMVAFISIGDFIANAYRSFCTGLYLDNHTVDVHVVFEMLP